MVPPCSCLGHSLHICPCRRLQRLHCHAYGALTLTLISVVPPLSLSLPTAPLYWCPCRSELPKTLPVSDHTKNWRTLFCFYHVTRMHSADYAVARCPPVCPSIQPSIRHTPIFYLNGYLVNGKRYGHSYYGRRIGNCNQAYSTSNNS